MSEQNVVESSSDTGSEAFEGDFGSDFEGGADDDGAGGSQPGPGLGQSKSSRRRRRKRKKLAGVPGAPAGVSGESGEGEAAPGGDGAAGAAYTPVVMAGESLALVSASASGVAQQANGFQANGSQSNGSQSNGAQNNGSQNNGSQRRSGGNGQQAGQGNGQAQGQGQGQGQGKRWKKKFRDRERRPGGPSNTGGEPRGDSSNGNGGSAERSFGGGGGYERPHRREGGRPDNFGNLVSTQHRKAKSGGGKERGFVGPMDHSYREANPEFGEAPPSTIQLRGRRGGHRHQGDSQPIDHNQPRPVPISEDAQTHIYLFVEDLFITAKVQETARKLGVKVAFIKNEKEAITELTNGEDTNRPSLIVFDLNNANAKPLTLIPKLKTKLKRSASIIGFLSSIQGDLKAKAVEAGIDTVMPKAAFSQNLPNLLRRYGVEETEEVNFNY